MLDIRVIREKADEVRDRLRLRGGDHWKLVDQVLETDLIRRDAETQTQVLQNQRKTISKQIGVARGKGEDTAAIEANVRGINLEITEMDQKASEASARQHLLLMEMPNLPHDACPHGSSEEDNPVIREWGTPPSIEDPVDHTFLTERNELVSWEDGIRISGSGFAVYRGEGAKLERALISFLLDTQVENGYEEVNVPHLVSRECMEGTGQLPKFEEDMYGTEPIEGKDTLFLAPTAEVPLTNLFRDQILPASELPKKLVAYTPCFRREAGSAGRDSKGLIRMHQFDKVELVQLVEPERGFDVLEELTAHAESVLQALKLHYRVIELCAGDLGQSSAKTYDIEVWAPGHGKYLEVSSCSCFGDYQARRMKTRYKDKAGKNRFPYTLNGSGTALPRLYVAILEQFQQSDGSIQIPEALVPYFGKAKIG